MVDFYQRVLGLEIATNGTRGTAPQRITFFRLSESFGGHIGVLALFEASETKSAAGPSSSLHHIALSLPWKEQDAAKAWFEEQGLPARYEYFDWAGWRGLFTQDPDGNTVELVAASPERHVT